LKTLDCGTKKVSWLLAVPISESEYSYLKAHGGQALESLLEERRVDVSDPESPSAV
jgi:antitoxin YqcF